MHRADAVKMVAIKMVRLSAAALGRHCDIGLLKPSHDAIPSVRN